MNTPCPSSAAAPRGLLRLAWWMLWTARERRV